MSRDFLLLAHPYKSQKHNIANWFISQKLDGMRAFWDGGISRGLFANDVPFANVEKDSRLLERPVATGLWSRYGKVIYAPSWWLNRLPQITIDGELFAGVKSFQTLISTVKRREPNDKDWESIRFMAFDSPPYNRVFADGEIKNANFKKYFSGVLDYFKIQNSPVQDFQTTFRNLERIIGDGNGTLLLLEQEQLSNSLSEAEKQVTDRLMEITNMGGEGLMARNPTSIWTPERSHNLLKVKKMLDAEGVVVGYMSGKETDKGSKLLGLMGSLRLSYKGVVFDLSGFTDEERRMTDIEGYDVFNYLCEHAGETVPNNIHNPLFPRGSTVTFRYRELTDGGVPKEARYWRDYDH